MLNVDMSKIEMAKQTVITIAAMLAISGTIVECRAASGLRLTCSGNLTNTREDGITLGPMRSELFAGQGPWLYRGHLRNTRHYRYAD